MRPNSPTSVHTKHSCTSGFTLIELLVVIAIIAILAVVVVLTLNPAELLRQSRDANRVSDMATITDALNLYVTDQTGASTFSLGNVSDTYPSIYDSSATSSAGDQCQGLGMPSLTTSTGQVWQCSPSSTYRNVNSFGWLPVNLNKISAGTPIGSLPVDPTNQTSSGLFYAYNTSGSQFEVTANLESNKYHTQYGNTPQTNYFPDVISGGTPTISALYNPNGLVGYWPLNEGSGTVAYDQSGNANNGAWNGTSSYTTGIVGTYAGSFNSTSYINVTGTAVLNPTTALTLAMWIAPSSACMAGSGCGVAGNADYEVGGYLFGFYSGGATFIVDASGVDDADYISASSYSAGSWAYFVTTYANSVLTTYVNGVQQGQNTVASSIGSSPYPFQIGRGTQGGWVSPEFSGLINDVRLYNRALSPAEVMALYNAEH